MEFSIEQRRSFYSADRRDLLVPESFEDTKAGKQRSDRRWWVRVVPF